MAHTVTLGGVPLNAERYGWRWDFRPGGKPTRATFTIPGYRVSEIEALIGTPQTLTIKATRFGAEGQTEETKNIKNVWVLGIDLTKDGPNEVAIVEVGDTRWLWASQRVDGRFNHIIPVNDADLLAAGFSPAVAGQLAGTASAGQADAMPISENGALIGFKPANVVGEHIQIPKFAYRRLTLKANGEPWTALELLMGILNGYEVPLARGGTAKVNGLLRANEQPATVERGLVDNKFPVARVDWFAEKPDAVIDYLCALARARLWVNEDGLVRLFPLDLREKPSLPPFGNQETSGRLYMRSFAMERAKAVDVVLRVEQEAMFSAGAEGDAAGTDPQATIPATVPGAKNDRGDLRDRGGTLLTNVIRLPVNMDLALGNKPSRTYAAGAYLPLEEVLLAKGISSAWVRRYILTSTYMDAAYANTKGLSVNQLTTTDTQFLAAVRECWRTYYQMDATWVESLVDLRGETVTILHPITGKRMPSPGWADYTLIRSARLGTSNLTALKAEALWKENRYARKNATNGEPADTEPPGPFLFKVLDPELGIIKLEPVMDQRGVIAEILVGVPLPGTADNIGLIPNATPQARANIQLAATFHCAGILTFQSFDPNTAGQFHTYTVQAGEVGATPGRVLEKATVRVIDETARFDRTGKLINEQMVRLRALAEAKLYYQSWQDRVVGLCVWSGLHSIAPFGPVNSVAWEMDSNGVFSTTVDAREPRPLPSVEQMLPRDIQHQRLKLLPPQS